MAYKIIMMYSDGTEEEQDEIFETEKEAEKYGAYLCSCSACGGETLNLSNPGDYPYDEDEEDDYRVEKI
jgi:hypothetical protein